MKLSLIAFVILMSGSVFATEPQKCADILDSLSTAVPATHTVGYDTYSKMANSPHFEKEVGDNNRQVLKEFIDKTYDKPLGSKIKEISDEYDVSSFDFLLLTSFVNAMAPKARTEFSEDLVGPEILRQNMYRLGSTDNELVRQRVQVMVTKTLVAVEQEFRAFEFDPSIHRDARQLILSILNRVDKNIQYYVKTKFGNITHTDILKAILKQVQVRNQTLEVQRTDLMGPENPKGLFLLTMDDVGIRTFNLFMQKGIAIFGLTDKEITVDGVRYNIISFFKHDIAHATLIASRSGNLEAYLKAIADLNERQRIMYDIVEFVAFHEIDNLGDLKVKVGYQSLGGGKVVELLSAVKRSQPFEKQVAKSVQILKSKMNLSRRLIERFYNPKDFAGLLPADVHVRPGETQADFVNRASDYFYEAIAVWALRNG